MKGTTPFAIGMAILLTLGSLSEVSARTKTSLNNGWRFQRADVIDAQQTRFEDSTWPIVNLPHTWNVEDPWDDEPGYYRGAGWYRRDLIIPGSAGGQRHFLYFEGANQVADVYVNGQKAGSHIGGYSAFAFDVTDFLIEGRNLVAVRVDNSFNEDIPPLTADFNFYGGIYRDVWLITTGDLHFNVTDLASPGVRLITPEIEKGGGDVLAIGKVINRDAVTRTFDVVMTVHDAARRLVASTASSHNIAPRQQSDIFAQTSVTHPKTWSPDSPYLYSVRLTIYENGKIVDEISQPLGFRWYHFDGENGFTLNGRPLKLHGTNRHQDHVGLGNALPDRLHVKDIQLIKDAGFNFLRLAHYPQDPVVLEACDRLGILVWEETPIVNYITKSPDFTENSENMVREMIRQHRNHPSVILWGYMNEIFLRVPAGHDELYPATVELARKLNAIAKEEDPTRSTTIALHGNEIYNRTGLADVPDVVGWNLYQGWYSATVEDFGKFLDDQHKRFPKRPLIVSEYGANGDLRLHSKEPRRFDSTVEYQRIFHESYLAQIQARPYLSGSAIWSQFDFGSEYRGDTIPHLNQKGMFTSNRNPKDIHFFYKAQFSDENVLHIAVGDTPKLASGKSTEHTITVYSNLPEVELFRDRKSLGKKAIDSTRKQIWVVQLKPGVNNFTARGRYGKRNIVDLAQVAFEMVSTKSNDIAVNVGSNADFLDESGKVWISDQPYSEGGWGFLGPKVKRIYSSTEDRNIFDTNAEPLLQTMAEGLVGYKLDVPDGDYDVELMFAETKFSAPGKRVFDVLLNGSKIIPALDLAASAGRDHVFRKQVSVTAKGGISITFVRLIGDPILSAIRIHRKK